MLLEQTASQLNKLSISRLVLADEPPARPSTPKNVRLPEPVRVRGDEEDCARILAGLSSPAYEPIDTFAKDHSRSNITLPPISQLFDGAQCLPIPAAPLIRRGSCDSLASSAPSLAYTSAVSSPSMSPEIPAFHVPAKFHAMNLSEQAFAEGMGYDSRGQRRPSVISHAQGGRIAKLSPSPPLSHYPSLQSALASKPRRAPPRPSPTGRGHINTPYAEEQNYWIIYHKVDLGLSWKEIEDRYNGSFPHLGRTDGGLQSTFYRFNDRTPMMTEDRLLVLDDNSPETYAGVGYRTHKVKARSSGKRGEISGRVTLIERYAEQVADRGYKWVHPKDLELARQIGLRRKQQRQEWLRRKAAMRTRMRH